MKKKIIMALLASTLIVSSLTGCGNTKLTKSSITIELGNEDAIKVTDILDISKDDAKSAKLNTKDVNFFKEGDYTATITYKDKDYDIKVKVKDTVAPEITVSDNIVVQTGNPLHMSDIITNVTELSGSIDVSFKDKPDTESVDSTESVSTTENTDSTDSTESGSSSVLAVGGCNLEHNDEITYTKAGDYDNTITVTDDAGNTSDIDIKISVIDAPSINGISDKSINVGDTIDYLSGVTATDGKGTDITGSIEVDSSTVDTNTVGTYQVTYKVTDSYGFSTGANCNITVNEKKEEVADNTSDDGDSSSDSGSKKNSSKKSKGNNSNSNSSSSGSSSSGSSSASSGGNSSSSSSGSSSSGQYDSDDPSSYPVDKSIWKYDTSHVDMYAKHGTWADGSPIYMSELDEAHGHNESAARYLLAAGAPGWTQQMVDEYYMPEDEFIAKYGYSNAYEK